MTTLSGITVPRTRLTTESVQHCAVDVAGGVSAAPQQGGGMSNFASRMGNIMVGSMAGGFGATLGSDAANSLWHDFF